MIVLLNASPRKHGTTGKALQDISQILTQREIKHQLIHVSDLNFKYCTGCMQCYKKGMCVFNDDIEKLSREIDKADGIIFGTPTCAMHMSGQLKTIVGE